MAAYQAGNQDAFAELFDRYAGRVYGFLVRRLGDVAYLLAVARLDEHDDRADTRARWTRSYAARSVAGSVIVPGTAIARRVASARYAAGSTPTSFADSMRL